MAKVAVRRTGITLPQNLIEDAGTVIEDFESVTGWSAAYGAVLALDAVNVKTGDNAISLTIADGQTLGSMTKTVNLDFSSVSTGGHVQYWVYVSNGTPTEALLMLATDVGFTKYFSFATALDVGWNLIDVPAPLWTNTGGAVWSDPVVLIRFRLAGTPGDAVVVDSLTASVVHLPAILITADDQWDEAWAMYTGMKSHGMIGTMYCVGSRLTDPLPPGDWLTLSQLGEMYDYGWNMANHSQTHPALTELSQVEQEAELIACQVALEAAGFTGSSRHVSYPGYAGGDEYDETVRAAMIASGMLTGRLVTTGYNPMAPLIDWYELLIQPTVFATSYAQACGWVDTAIAQQLVLIVLIHRVTPEARPGAGEMDVTVFLPWLEYIVAQGVPVLTISQLYALKDGPLTVRKPY